MHLIEVKCIVTFSIYGSQNRKQRQAWEKHQFRISLPLFPRHFKKLVIAIALIIRILTCYSQVTKSFWNQSNSLHYLAFQSSPDFLLGWNRGGYIQIEVFCEQESEILRIGIGRIGIGNWQLMVEFFLQPAVLYSSSSALPSLWRPADLTGPHRVRRICGGCTSESWTGSPRAPACRRTRWGSVCRQHHARSNYHRKICRMPCHGLGQSEK